MVTKTIPFDLETAKKIQTGEIKGKIKTKQGKEARIICTDKASTDNDNRTQIVCLIRLGAIELVSINDPNTGQCWDIEDGKAQHLVLEVYDTELEIVEETQRYHFKPFDRVLVRNDDEEIWQPRLYEMYSGGTEKHYCQDGQGYLQCIPYEGNEHLASTTDEPKE